MRGTPGNPQVDRLNYLVGLLAGGSGVPGGRNWTHTAFFVDPSNVSGTASDSNSGLSPGTAILTIAELGRRLFLKNIVVPATITEMSDDPIGTFLDLSTVSIANGGSLTFQGTPQVLHTGGTLNGGTLAINPVAAGGGQRQTAHTSDLGTFAPFVLGVLGGGAAHPCYVVMTDGPNAGTSAWVVSGAATASMSRPMDTTQQNAGTLSIGDHYNIQRGSLLSVGGATSQSFQVGFITFNDFTFPSFNVASPGSADPFCNRCAFDTVGLASTVNNNCFFADDLSFVAGGGYFLGAGVWLLTGGNTGDTVVELTSDVYIRDTPAFAQALNCNGNVNGNLAVFSSLGVPSGIQLQDISHPVAAMLNGSSPATVTGSSGVGLIWGNGNAGLGMAIEADGAAVVPSSVGNVPSVTGTLGDFGFISEATGTILQVARAFDSSVGQYTETGGPATRATTWANFIAALGAGGFHFQAHNPATSASIIGVS